MSYDKLPTTESEYRHDYVIAVDPGHVTRLTDSTRSAVKREAKDLEDALHQLSGYEDAVVEVLYTGPELCKYCGYEMETKDGMPVCCQEAREHMTTQAVAGEEIK